MPPPTKQPPVTTKQRRPKALLRGGGGEPLPAAPFLPILNEGDAYPWLLLKLNRGQSVVVQNGCLAYIDAFLKYDTQNVGGVWQGVQRLFAQASFFMNVVTNETDEQGTVAVSAPGIGSIQEVTLSEDLPEYMFNEQSIVAFTANVEVSATLRFKGIFAGGPIFQHAKLKPGTGTGKVWICTFGNLSTIDLRAGQTLKIDNDYFVACNANTDFGLSTFAPASAGTLSTIKNFLISPYAFVLTFTGPVKIHVQTKSLKRFANQLAPYMPQPSRSDAGGTHSSMFEDSQDDSGSGTGSGWGWGSWGSWGGEQQEGGGDAPARLRPQEKVVVVRAPKNKRG